MEISKVKMPRVSNGGRFVTMLVGWLVGWLFLLPRGAGWYIMGYELDPLPYYLELCNCFYSVGLITPLTSLFGWLVYRVLIPPVHHLA